MFYIKQTIVAVKMCSAVTLFGTCEETSFYVVVECILVGDDCSVGCWRPGYVYCVQKIT